MGRKPRAEIIHPVRGYWDQQPNMYMLEMHYKFGVDWDTRSWTGPSSDRTNCPMLCYQQGGLEYEFAQLDKCATKVYVEDKNKPHSEQRQAEFKVVYLDDDVRRNLFIELNKLEQSKLEEVLKVVTPEFKISNLLPKAP
jgi:hypothetical protein